MAWKEESMRKELPKLALMLKIEKLGLELQCMGTTGLNIDLLNFLSLSDFVCGSEAAHGGRRSLHFFLLVLAIGSRSRNM